MADHYHSLKEGRINILIWQGSIPCSGVMDEIFKIAEKLSLISGLDPDIDDVIAFGDRMINRIIKIRSNYTNIDLDLLLEDIGLEIENYGKRNATTITLMIYAELTKMRDLISSEIDSIIKKEESDKIDQIISERKNFKDAWIASREFYLSESSRFENFLTVVRDMIPFLEDECRSRVAEDSIYFIKKALEKYEKDGKIR